jgi:hypothetical protein
LVVTVERGHPKLTLLAPRLFVLTLWSQNISRG